IWKENNTGTPVEMIGSTDTLLHSGTDTLRTTLSFKNGPIVLMPGTYVIADIQFDNTSAIASCDETYTEGQLWYYTTANGWSNSTPSTLKKAPVLRMNLHPYIKPGVN